MTRVIDGDYYADDVCGHTVDAGPPIVICGQPGTYVFRLNDWGAWEFGLVCDEHVVLTREKDIEFIKTYRPLGAVGERITP